MAEVTWTDDDDGTRVFSDGGTAQIVNGAVIYTDVNDELDHINITTLR